ncbi:hypothetical protein LCGC14_0142720 [marine sediment metagenome]|uniref:Uncharacterized protein n=1 Tax=marine sediment metagenome TaxID=412755 RepID=A0A0F9VGR0_9ZZZZ
MSKRITRLLLVAGFLFCVTGCSIVTNGEASWEVFMGARHKQIGEKPASVGIQSKVIEDVISAMVGTKDAPEDTPENTPE